jgi:hypothetical protein
LRCSLCEEPAVTLVRYAKLRLCRKHFVEFVRRVIKTIERYRLVQSGWRVLIAVSGGKDSSLYFTYSPRCRSSLTLR